MAIADRVDITSANTSLVLTVEELYPSGIELHQFSTDQMFTQGDVQLVEDRMGVDGYLVAGFVSNVKEVTIMLEASSDSYDALAEVARAMEANKKIYLCTLVARAPSLGKTFTWSKGVLYSGTVVPAAQRVYGPTTWVFHFESIDTSNA